MGLLDDAIREHLELKRLRGADPALVSHEEREALGAIPGGEPGEDRDRPVAPLDDGEGTRSQPKQTTGEAGDFAHGQETAEIDMQTVLHEESPAEEARSADAGTVAPVRARPHSGQAAPGADGPGDGLEWEVPGDDSRETQAESSEGAIATPTAEESVEDVLEETPDFLRDTPEQERLWFEQRPPRDFDFDK